MCTVCNFDEQIAFVFYVSHVGIDETLASVLNFTIVFFMEQISIEDAIAEAQKTCEDDPTSAPCAVAWDEVEEKSTEIAHQRNRKKSTNDPLEKYYADNPKTDECRTYED